MKDRYWSKLLLFGEYSMIFDGCAVVIPLKRFSASWTRAQGTDDAFLCFSNRELARFRRFLAENPTLAGAVNTSAFADDLADGWALASNVPLGYGLGSSGTVVAAVYDRYADQKTSDAMELKKLFSRMESFFHGSSSGIDPLQCYLGKPFRIGASGIRTLPDAFPEKGIRICLIDTGTKSDTRPLVESFRKQRDDVVFLHDFEQTYLPCVRECTDSLIQGDSERFFPALRQLSASQLRFFRAMIPDSVLSLFESSFEFRFGIKILGSGGGGYMLGFTDNPEKVSGALEGKEVLWI